MDTRDQIIIEVLKLLPDLARGLNRAVAAHCDLATPSTPPPRGPHAATGAPAGQAPDAAPAAPSAATPRPVTTAMMRAIIHLAQYGPQTMSELATGLKITTASATGLVDPLVELGYVTRSRDPDDRRVVRVTLTDEARALAERILAGLRAEVAAALAGLDDEACRIFLSALEQLAARWSETRPAQREGRDLEAPRRATRDQEVQP